MSLIGSIIEKAQRTLLRRGGVSIDDADDLVQEAFVRIERYRKDENVRSQEAMLVRTAINLSIDEKRRARRSPFENPTRDIEEIVDLTPGPEEILNARAGLRHLDAGLMTLSEKSRRILLARRIDDLSVAEIARRESMSIAAVEKQIARATLRLMKWMDGW